MGASKVKALFEDGAGFVHADSSLSS